jgi:curved DNA-binding protein CbpA
MNMHDPYLILNVSREANDEAIHQAYLQAIRECPPEKDAQRFQAVRHAYETLRTEKLRLEYELFNTDLPSIEDLLQQGLTVQQEMSRPNLKTFQGLLKTGAKIAAKTKPTDQ